MNQNSLVIMLILIVVSGGLLYVDQREDYTEVVAPPETLARLSQLNPELIDAIELSKGESAFQIRRKGKDWFLPTLWDSAADRDEILRFIDDFSAIEGAEKRGESTASHGTFQVDAEQGIRVVLKDLDMKPMADFVIGKSDGAGRSFLRLSDEDQVYSVKPNLRRRTALGGDGLVAESWFRKILYELPEDSKAREIILTRGDERIVLEWVPGAPADAITGESGELVKSGTDPEWWIREPENIRADTNTVKGLISALKNVRCEGPLDPADEEGAGLTEPSASIEVTFVDDTRVILEFGANRDLPFGGEGVTARLKGDRRIVVTQNWVRDGLIKGLAELKAVEPVAPKVQGGAEGAIPGVIPANDPADPAKEKAPAGGAAGNPAEEG
ncbi:MAG: hypothetical protein CBC13_02615 [Planctomycetia bacterium TMED53]|nr:MAG: hypothetical protein CBC13_02615 [Planctomycetia bacterium TMED53]